MDATPFVGVIGAIIGWTGFIIALTIVKNFIVHGCAVAIAEWLIKISDPATQERICTWLGDSNRILKELQYRNDLLAQSQESEKES